MLFDMLSNLMLCWGSPACDRSGSVMLMYSFSISELGFPKVGIEPCFLKKIV
jgi:hypothetical protein